jgi:hypothetical protein
MLNKNEICNLALARLGVSLGVIDIATENSNQAKVIRRHYKLAFETLLEKHPWNFTTSYAVLVLQATNPIRGFKWQYALPADCLVLRQIATDGCFPHVNLYESEKARWKEVYTGASPSIYTNVENAHAEYTVKISEDQAMPNHFGLALAAQLSMMIASQLITNNFSKVSQMLNADAKNDISLGIAEDLGRQPLAEDSPSPFHLARFGDYVIR